MVAEGNTKSIHAIPRRCWSFLQREGLQAQLDNPGASWREEAGVENTWAADGGRPGFRSRPCHSTAGWASHQTS